MKPKKIIKEKFIIDPYQGAAGLAMSLIKPGYSIQSVERKNSKVTITYIRNDENLK